MTRHLPALALVLLPLAPPAFAQTPPSPVAVYDETTLRQAGVGTDAASLLKLLREHARDGGGGRKTADLITALGSTEFAERERATLELIAVGRPALDALRKARKGDDDPEVRLRAGLCVEAIENTLDPNLSF